MENIIMFIQNLFNSMYNYSLDSNVHGVFDLMDPNTVLQGMWSDGFIMGILATLIVVLAVLIVISIFSAIIKGIKFIIER